MQKLALAVVFVSINGLFLWLIARGEAGFYLLIVGAAAALTNLVLGIRMGYASAVAYSQDVARLNRYLCDQNEDLVLSNRELLERFTSPASESTARGDGEPASRTRAQS